MIEPPHSSKQPRDPHWGLNGGARINRAAQLASDLQHILSFVDRECNRPTRAAHPTPAPMAQPPPAAPSPPPEPDIHSLAAALESTRLERTQRGPAEARRIHSIALPIAAWRDGLLRQGPWLVSATLSALIAVDLARASMTLFFGGLPKPSLPAAARETRAAERPAVDVRSIVAAQLFGVFAADSSPQDPSGPPQSVAHLLLAGTLATENPNTGLAIIRDTGPAAVYEVGASVGGAYLQSVYRDRVILSRDGRLETLALPKQSVGKGKPAAAAAAVPAAPDVMRGKLNRKAFDSSGLRRDVTAYAPDNSSPPE